jgi:hypothetical protein
MYLPLKIVEKLKRAPENGMGYQIVDLILANGEIRKSVFVYNCTVVDGEYDIIDVKVRI